MPRSAKLKELRHLLSQQPAGIVVNARDKEILELAEFDLTGFLMGNPINVAKVYSDEQATQVREIFNKHKHIDKQVFVCIRMPDAD